MSIETWEVATSGTTTVGEDSTHEKHYAISGTDSDISAISALAAKAPLYYAGLVRKSLHIDPDGHELWKGTASYGMYGRPKSIGESRITFDTGGGTIRTDYTLGTVNRYAPQGQTPIDSKGLIGVTRDSVAGCDVPSREFHWSETHILPLAFIDFAYVMTLYRLSSTVNAGPWRAFASGEVLFKNVTGSPRDQTTCDLTFNFAASPNIANFSIGDIHGISKQGWDYLWVRYEDDVDANAHALIKKPLTVYVERVIERSDFMLLGIG